MFAAVDQVLLRKSRMSLKSMTGYGRAEAEHQGRVWSIEVRSVNNRFLDAKVKLPRNYGSLEDSIRRKIAGYHMRGRVDLNLSVSGSFSDLVRIGVDFQLARSYHRSLLELAKDLDIKGKPDLSMLISLPDVITREQQLEDLDQVWPRLEPLIDDALEQCLLMRSTEAEALVRDLRERLDLFGRILDEIEQNIGPILQQRQEAMQDRLQKLLANIELDPARLAQEMAVLADKSDVTEELVRLRSHIDQFAGLLKSAEPVGRKLDFLIQEFLREVNTIASKITDAETAHKTVTLKSELEKMREQIQNIE
jgi:uncharacterized protein (TIGR00255 family)